MVYPGLAAITAGMYLARWVVQLPGLSSSRSCSTRCLYGASLASLMGLRLPICVYTQAFFVQPIGKNKHNQKISKIHKANHYPKLLKVTRSNIVSIVRDLPVNWHAYRFISVDPEPPVETGDTVDLTKCVCTTCFLTNHFRASYMSSVPSPNQHWTASLYTSVSTVNLVSLGRENPLPLSLRIAICTSIAA